MRRSSYTPLSMQSQNEPLIVVEETGGTDDEGSNKSHKSSPRQSIDVDSPIVNPYLLSPWRDTRKHSLPTPSCTSGITASQVRRLSERGGEGSGPSVREAAFLATLCSAPAPQPGGRRHSVVTISRVPPALFGRNRRESIAAFPTAPGMPSRSILASRRESTSSVIGPPSSSDHRGSIHNLQLDIMDDIVTARKVRMKMWNTSNERVCEVQPLDESSPATSPMRYTQQSGSSRRDNRRYSDFVGTSLPPPIPPTKRRASEFPVFIPSTNKSTTVGIVCTNTDLDSILTSSSLTSSATEINQCGLSKTDNSKSTTEQKRNRLKNSRSNSFDVSILHAVNQEEDKLDSMEGPTSWFIKRHQPMSKKNETKTVSVVTFIDEIPVKEKDEDKSSNNTVLWDERSGSVVDAEALGSAIEGFLKKGTGSESPISPSGSVKGTNSKTGVKSSGKSSGSIKISSPSSWFSGKGGDEDSTETCDTSLCSTIKDLFVK